MFRVSEDLTATATACLLEISLVCLRCPKDGEEEEPGLLLCGGSKFQALDVYPQF